MVETIMVLGIGFMAGCLMLVAFLPAIHNRAVRLTARRYQAKTPLSVFEMEAQKDLMRADFAMSLRRLEMIAEETKAKSVLQLGEIGRQAAEIHILKCEMHDLKEELADAQAKAEPTPASRLRAALLRAGVALERIETRSNAA
jgi:hypothetical protein